MFLAKMYESLKKIMAEYPLHQLVHLGCQEINISLSNPNIDVRILAQGY